MEDEGMKTDQLTLLSAQSLSGAMPADQQMNAVDDSKVTLDDSAHSSICAPEVAAALNCDEDSMTEYGTAGASSNLGGQTDAHPHDRSVEVAKVGLSKSQRKRKYRAEKKKKRKRRDKQASSVQGGDSHVGDSTEEVFAAYATPKRSPFSRPDPNFAHPTEASLAKQAEKFQLSPSSKLPWKSAGSSAVPNPGSAHKSTSFVPLSRTNSQICDRSRRNEGHRSPHYETTWNSSPVSQYDLQQYETSNKTENLRVHWLAAIDLGTSNIEQSSERNESIVGISSENMDPSAYDMEIVDPEDVVLLDENQLLREKLHWVDEGCQYLTEELRELRGDVDCLCEAWLKACGAASVTSHALEHFHFLVTDSDVDKHSRAAVRQELVSNELYHRISDMQDTIQSLQLGPNQKNKVIAAYQAGAGSGHGTSLNDTSLQHDLTNWRSVYEKEQQRFEALKEQNKRLRSEAERMYQPDLERRYKQCQTDLIEAQDRNAFLAEEMQRAKKEALSWQNEVKQHKEELVRRSAQFDEQTRIQNEEMLSAVKEYRSKVNDCQHWDKDGLIMQNERLEREQVVLTEELEHVNRSNASKADEIAKLFEKQEQYQREIKELRDTWSNVDIVVHERDKGKLLQQDVDELREKRRKQREEEDAVEALKEKVRRLRIKEQKARKDQKDRKDQRGQDPPAKAGVEDLEEQSWWVRWRGDEYFDKLTEWEKELSKRW